MDRVSRRRDTLGTPFHSGSKWGQSEDCRIAGQPEMRVASVT